MDQREAENQPATWLNCMRQGKFEQAWQFSDAALEERKGKPCWHWPRHYQYIWDGSSLAGKRVLVRCYHGLGDTIQFIRYMPLLKAIAAETIVWAQDRLIPLLQSAAGIDRLLPLHDGTPDVEYDVDVELMELPHFFRTTVATIPATIPYLNVPPTPLAKKAGTLAVGLVWRSGDWELRRTIDFTQLEPLKHLEGISFYILQANAIEAGWDQSFGIYSCQDSLEGDAALIKSLDLMITVDTMTAHLAGALGVPVWTLLPTDADWRWMENRDDSPWYPTMRLFRQEVAGDWDGVIAKLVNALQTLVVAKR